MLDLPKDKIMREKLFIFLTFKDSPTIFLMFSDAINDHNLISFSSL